MDDTEYTYIPADTVEWSRVKGLPKVPRTALQEAQRAAVNANMFARPCDPAEEMQYALMFAALAQAEALTRIAEVLEQHLDDAAHDGLRRLIQTTFGD